MDPRRIDSLSPKGTHGHTTAPQAINRTSSPRPTNLLQQQEHLFSWPSSTPSPATTPMQMHEQMDPRGTDLRHHLDGSRPVDLSLLSPTHRHIQPQGQIGNPQTAGTPIAARTRPIASITSVPDLSGPPSSCSSGASVMAPPATGMTQLGKRRREDHVAAENLSPSPAPPSKRATPDPTASVIAPSMSRDSSQSSLGLDVNDSDEETWKQMYGYNPNHDKKRFKEEQRQAMMTIGQESALTDQRLLQEQQDELFARQLQQEEEERISSTVNSSSQRSNWNSTSFPSTQTYFEPSGQYRLQRPSSPMNHLPAMLNSNRSTNEPLQGNFNLSAPRRPPASSIDSNDDDLEIIDASAFKPNLARRLQTMGETSRISAAPSRAAFSQFGRPVESVDLTSLEHGNDFDGNLERNTPMTTMDALSSRGPYQPVYSTLDMARTSLSQPPALGHEPTMNPAGLFDNDFAPSSSIWQTHMPWGVDDGTSSYGRNGTPDLSAGYGLGNYGGESEQSAEALKDLLNNIRPDEDENLGAAERGDGTPEGMADTANLYKYQQKGLAWLTKMEEGTNRGAILADDMGLGKTIQAIALMVSRRPSSPDRRTTLIIAPVALIRQWESEISTKVRTSHKFSIYIYHGSGKTSATWDTIRRHDVVISTYGTLTADHKKKMELAKKLKDNPAYVARPNEKPVLTGDGCKFYRCILDEAQNIKNRSAKAAVAAFEIKADFRLCMTGTPMMNNVIEMFSLIHFLKIQPYCQWEKFNVDFARPLRSTSSYGRERAMQKLQALCKAVMLRRTKKSEMDGKPLITLPERRMESVHAAFDEDEQAFYDALEKKTQLTFNKYLKAGTVGRNYTNMLTLLLRLRQACCHPHLIKDFAVAVDSEIPPEVLFENARLLPKIVIDRIIENGITDCPVCMDAADNYTIFNPCGHSTCPECFCSLADSSQNPNASQMETAGSKAKFPCVSCRREIDPTMATDYLNFQKVHEPEKATAEGPGDTEGSSSETDSTESDDETEDSQSDGLNDFIVEDDAPIEKESGTDDSEDDLDREKPMKRVFDENRNGKTKSAVKVAVKSEPQTAEGSHNIDELDDLGVLTPAKFSPDKQGKLSPGAAELLEKANWRVSKKRKEDVSNESHGEGEFLPGYNDGDNPFEKAGGKKMKGKGKGSMKVKKKEKKAPTKTLAELKKEAMRNAASRKEYFKRIAKHFIPSAKINKCMEILKNVMESPENEKVIVFSQFTSLLDLVEIPLNRQRWGYRRFDGSMDAVSRNRSVVNFTNDPSVRILLVSLKAGNAGLNLTAGSQVIILDPFWNPYIEEQAIDRAHRIGQRRPVQVHRILIPETVEDRILNLQNKKRELIEGALDESASSQIGRLGIRDLSYLFGIRS